MKACDDLDAYLLGDLSGPEEERFRRHLPECGACRKEAELDLRLDRVLWIARRRLERPPAGLRERIESRLREEGRRRFWRRAAIAAAAAILLAGAVRLGWEPPLTPGPRAPGARTMGPAPAGPQLSGPAPSRPGDEPIARIGFGPGTPAFALPVETRSRDFTIYLVYPTQSPLTGAPTGEGGQETWPETKDL